MPPPHRLSSSPDLTQFIRPGDAVLWSQGPAEPSSLTRALVEQRRALSGATAFVGLTTADVLQPAHADHLRMLSYCGLARNSALLEAGALDVVPCHYSQLPSLIDTGAIACDVVFLHLSPVGPDGMHSMGITRDYIANAARRARVVIAEINDQMPWTHGSQPLNDLRIDAVLHSSRPLHNFLASPPNGDIESRIAHHTAPFVLDGDVLEMGIGSIPDAILASLSSHKDLGIHSGMLSDGALRLIESGVVTNARKTRDAGMTTTGVLLGTDKLYRFARQNPILNLQPPGYTHAIAVLAQLENFVAINSAIEVDLTGQVNGEVVNGRYVGAIGGQTDFVRGAQSASNGRSIIALPSTARNGSISRIVAKLNDATVTTPRSDADIFVTEWGAAQLKGQPLRERMRRMIAIAHPNHREELERAAHTRDNT